MLVQLTRRIYTADDEIPEVLSISPLWRFGAFGRNDPVVTL